MAWQKNWTQVCRLRSRCSVLYAIEQGLLRTKRLGSFFRRIHQWWHSVVNFKPSNNASKLHSISVKQNKKTLSHLPATTYVNRRRGVVVLLRASERKMWSTKFYKNILVFVRKGIRNLKCYVAPAKSLIWKRVCSGRHTLNQIVWACKSQEKRCKIDLIHTIIQRLTWMTVVQFSRSCLDFYSDWSQVLILSNEVEQFWRVRHPERKLAYGRAVHLNAHDSKTER